MMRAVQKNFIESSFDFNNFVSISFVQWYQIFLLYLSQLFIILCSFEELEWAARKPNDRSTRFSADTRGLCLTLLTQNVWSWIAF